MSITRSYQATFQIVNLAVGAGGTGVAIWRDARNNYLYLATAYHVVEDMSNDGIFIDYLGRKYTNFAYIVLDKTYDYALVEVRDVPTSIPVVTIATRTTTPISHGMDVYVIGWPLLMDSNSVSSGSLRSPRWTANGTMNQLLISAPVFGGNSGGGVFLRNSNELIGVVSWGMSGDETMNGIVPYTVILESLFYFMYRPSLATPSRVHGESYLFGVEGLLIDPFTMQYWLQPNLPSLSAFGNVGTIVLSVLPGSPAAVAGFNNLVLNGSGYTFDIIWAFRRPGGEYTYITEENALDNILYSFYVTSNHSRRRIIPRRSQNERAYTGLDVVLPTTFQIECLTSRVVNTIPDNNFVVKTVTLVKRDAYYQTVGSDPSSFGNEYLYGKLNEIRASGLLKNSVKTYGQELLKRVVGGEST
jgi:S1-C subfamily serine protease